MTGLLGCVMGGWKGSLTDGMIREIFANFWHQVLKRLLIFSRSEGKKIDVSFYHNFLGLSLMPYVFRRNKKEGKKGNFSIDILLWRYNIKYKTNFSEISILEADTTTMLKYLKTEISLEGCCCYCVEILYRHMMSYAWIE